jgi:hypothetical protein
MSARVKELPMSVELREYAGWPDAWWLANGEVELVVPTQIGPRVMRYGRVGGPNLFHNFTHALGHSGEPVWQNRGGHRLWAAPETPASKALDNSPVEVSGEGLRLAIRQRVEPESGLEKEMEIELAAEGTAVTVLHRITNRNAGAVRLAPWGLSVMRPGGVAVAGFPPRFRHDERLLPTNPLVMWGYTDFSDPRWRFTRRFLRLRQDPGATAPQKAGLFAENAWAAYAVEDEVFLKRARARTGAEYPDFGCSVEIFTNAAMLEVETLGRMETVEPEGVVEHVEQWSLHQDAGIADAPDEELAGFFYPLMAAAE